MIVGTRRLIGIVAIALFVCACSGSATPAPSAQTTVSQPPPSTAASQEAPSTEPSVEAPSTEPSAQAPSEQPIPSLSLPSNAKDLEALLPDKVCGAKAIKASQTGDEFANQSTNQDFVSVLQALGKTPSDVAFAVAVSTSECVAGIFRIKGVDTGLLESTFLAEEQKSGNTYTQKTVGGKSVYVSDDTGSKTYGYFKGDAFIFTSAKTETDAASVLAQLP